MSIPRTVEAKVGDWSTAFWAVKAEITPQAIRDIKTVMEGATDPGALAVAERLTRMIFANDRTAAIVAAMLTTQGGIKPAFVDLEEG